MTMMDRVPTEGHRYTVAAWGRPENDDPGIAPLPVMAQALLDAEYANMSACVRCGLCLTSCPTYVVSGHESEGPRGRIALMRALVEGRIPLTDDLIDREESCLSCDACTAVCPAGVHMEPLQVAFRASVEASRDAGGVPPRGLLARALRSIIFGWLFTSMARLRAVVWLVWFYRTSGLRALARTLGIVRLLGLRDADDLIPEFSPDFLVPTGQIFPADDSSSDRTSVALFAGCVMSTAFGSTALATARVLSRAGCEVACPARQGCCGALHAHGGDREGARKLAREVIESFEPGADAPVIVNAAGCGAMMKEYGHLLADDTAWAGRAKAFSARVRDVSEFLITRELPQMSRVSREDVNVTYQDACHLAHAQRVTSAPRDLIRRIPGVTLRDLPDKALCCGSAGVYNVTHPEMARTLGERKALAVGATGASIMVTANPGCHLQMQARLSRAGLGVRVMHVVDLLDLALAREKSR
jgi:glycolate oxidase iron-sulfur subunit